MVQPVDADRQRLIRDGVTGESGRDSALRVLHRAIHSCRLCTGLPAVAVPKVHGSARARVVVVGQALSLAESMDPAARPFDDATGRTLRRWLGVDEATFYDPDLFYLTALGKCFPGKAPAGGDLPPRRACYTGDGHGGGDWGLIAAFVSAMRGERQDVLTSARESVESHLLAFAAEEARLSGDSIDMAAYRAQLEQDMATGARHER